MAIPMDPKIANIILHLSIILIVFYIIESYCDFVNHRYHVQPYFLYQLHITLYEQCCIFISYLYTYFTEFTYINDSLLGTESISSLMWWLSYNLHPGYVWRVNHYHWKIYSEHIAATFFPSKHCYLIVVGNVDEVFFSPMYL